MRGHAFCARDFCSKNLEAGVAVSGRRRPVILSFPFALRLPASLYQYFQCLSAQELRTQPAWAYRSHGRRDLLSSSSISPLKKCLDGPSLSYD